MRLQERIGSPDGILLAARTVKVLSPMGSVEEPRPGPFNSLLRRFRERIGLTQRGLASRIGVTQSAVARWESGASIPRRSVFLKEEPDRRAVGTGPLEELSFRLALSLSQSEWDALSESYAASERETASDPRRKVIRSLSRLGMTYSVRPRPERAARPSTSRVKRFRSVRVLKDALVLDAKGRPVSDELLSAVLSAAREADSLFLLSGLTKRTGNETYGGFRRKVLRAALEVFDRNPRGKAGRPSGS